MSASGLANLGMYPFADVRWAFDRFWEAVTERLDWVPERLDWSVDLHDSWLHDDLVVGHTCGWPLVTRLRGQVRVIGAFAHATPEAEGHAYRSVLVARWPGSPADLAGQRAAVNGFDSLSGWVSLVAAVHGPGGAWAGDVVVTGSHVESLRAVADGRADIASIDGVTWWHARRAMPDVVSGLAEVGVGPLVPSLPLVTSRLTSDARLRELSVAIVDAVLDPLVEPAARAMCVVGFEPLDLDHYLPLLDLAPAARPST